MAAQPSIGGVLCESSVIPFLIPCRKVWLTPTAPVLCSNTANVEKHKIWTQSEFCSGQNSVRGHEPPKMYLQCTSQGDSETSCKGLLTSVERRWCSNEAKTPNFLKFAGVPQTRQQVSAASGLTFTILWEHVEEILLFSMFFFDCWYMP